MQAMGLKLFFNPFQKIFSYIFLACKLIIVNELLRENIFFKTTIEMAFLRLPAKKLA